MERNKELLEAIVRELCWDTTWDQAIEYVGEKENVIFFNEDVRFLEELIEPTLSYFIDFNNKEEIIDGIEMTVWRKHKDEIFSQFPNGLEYEEYLAVSK